MFPSSKRSQFWTFFLCFFAAAALLCTGLLLYRTGLRGESVTAVFYAAMLFLALCYFSANDTRAYFCLIVLISAFCLVYISTGDIFSVVDEAAHYYNIHYILASGHLPNMNIDPAYYEAVQPPVYYWVCSLLCLPISDKLTRIFLLRGFSFLLWWGCVYLTLCVLRLLEREQVISIRPARDLALLLLFWATPGTLVRFSTVSNEALAVLFSTAALFFMINFLFYHSSFRSLILSVLFISLSCLTKITALFLLAPLLCILLSLRKGKLFFPCLAAVLLALIPWFCYNWYLYGAFTGTAQHLSYVLPLVNPSAAPVRLLPGLMSFLSSYFYPTEAAANGWILLLLRSSGFLAFLALLALSFPTFLYGIRLLKGRFEESKEGRRSVIFLFAALAVAGNLAVLIFGTLTSRVDVLLGRYFYHSALPLTLLCALGQEKLSQKLSSFLRAGICSFVAVLQVNVLQQFFLAFLSR